jgi:hypothetical protein
MHGYPLSRQDQIMSSKIRILWGMTIATLLLGAGLFFLFRHLSQDAALISISTDRQSYRLDDTIQVSIRNQGKHPIDIYCQQFCALGNFPTEVEQYSNGQWQYSIGFCPSIEPLFGSGEAKGSYILHTLSAKDAFELELENLTSLRLEQAERYRLVYYVGFTKIPVYSNEFTIGP